MKTALMTPKRTFGGRIGSTLRRAPNIDLAGLSALGLDVPPSLLARADEVVNHPIDNNHNCYNNNCMSKPTNGKPLTPAARGRGAPYQRVPAYLIRRLQMISTAIITEAFEGEDMSLSEWAVLTIIENHPDVDQSRLADIVSIDRVNTGRVVDQLESKGLVERLADEKDRRVWKLRCTRAGLQKRKRLLPCALASQRKLLACLAPQDRKSLIELMLQIIAANEKYIRPGAGRRKRKVQPAENG